MSPPRAATGSSVRQPDGTGRWTTWVDVDVDESDFDRLGADFEAAGATAYLISQPVLVDFATAWMAANRLPKESPSKEPLAR
ncbi:AAC(3) family N-acetyltransferase [Micromonospora endophytica]|uniref:AAC(3) family N-acetyltransferase n=1 Tax=Micromonospora endophytica TaxID=515350 RepID=UPI001CB962F3|nr:AAC(3) family N-acetyltransferase [Micromonospora endophytica]